eukprot:SAG11_NODE_6115_length_1385_cov_2.651633_1_plen_143_part_00
MPMDDHDHRGCTCIASSSRVGCDFSIGPSPSPERACMLSDREYDAMMCRVMALPPKKRKDWKESARDKRNVKTRVRYYEGKLKCYDPYTHKFVDIVCPRQLEMYEFEPTSILGMAQILAIEFDEPRIMDAALDTTQKLNALV